MKRVFVIGEPMNFTDIIRGENALKVVNAGDTAEIYILGSIGKSWWDDSGVSEQEVRDALKAIPKGKAIAVHVNSDGGSVKDGLGIYNAIKERSADVTCFVDGYALSIASVFPLAASKVVSPKSAIWMMHKAWCGAQGNSDDMTKCAEMLEEHDEMLAEIYAKETGRPIAEMRSAMESETWIRGSAAVEFGLADETDEEEVAASYTPRIFARCANVPQDILAAAKTGRQPTNINPGVTAASLSAPLLGAATNQNQIMNKTLIVAFLTGQGIEAADTETEAQLQAKLDAIPKKAKATATAVVKDDELETEPAIVNRLERIETRAIRAEIVRIGTNKIPNDQLDRWVKRAKSEGEDLIYAEISAMLENRFGGDSVGGGALETDNTITFNRMSGEGVTGVTGPVSDRIVNIHTAHKTPMARRDAMAANWNELVKEVCRKDKIPTADFSRMVFNTNTYSGTLITSFLMDGALTPLTNVWPMLNAFSIDSSPDPYKPKATGVLKKVTVAGTTQTNATNFESGDSTVAPISVTMAQLTNSWQVSNSDLNSGLRMMDLVKANAAAFADSLISAALAPVTAANFTGTPVIQSAAAFGWSDAQQLRGLLKKSPIKNLILDGDYMARLENVPTNFQNTDIGNGPRPTFGWNGIYENTNWTGAGANVRGFACNPQAVVGITGLPLTTPIPSTIMVMTTFTLPGMNISIAIYQWFNTSTRTMWMSYDIMEGFALGDATAGYLVASGTPT